MAFMAIVYETWIDTQIAPRAPYQDFTLLSTGNGMIVKSHIPYSVFLKIRITEKFGRRFR